MNHVKQKNHNPPIKRAGTIFGNIFNLAFLLAFIGLLFYCLGIEPRMGAANKQHIFICISLACGGMLMMAIYNSALRLFSRREKAAQYFSLFCVGQSVRFFFMPGSVGEVVFPDLDPMVVTFALRYMPFCLAVVGLVLFIYEIYGEGRSKKLKHIVLVTIVAINIVIPSAGLDFTIWRAILGLPVAILVNGVCIYVLLKSPLLKQDRLSLLYLFGFILYIFSWLNSLTTIDTGPIIAVAFNFLFAVIHAVLLSGRFARAVKEVEEANIALEDRVAERTAELREANENLSASEQNMRDMARNVSHEVRTPLTVMSTYAQLAVEQIRTGEPDEQMLEGLAAISEEAQRLADYASVALAPKGEKERVADIGEITGQLVRLFEPLAKKNHQEFRISLEESLLTFGNVGEITQVLWNLMDNVLKYAGKGIIEIEGNHNEEYVYIIIADNGAGISGELMPKIFERGVSGGKGQGLGLAISNEIVSHHKGRLLIESEPGFGTQVTMLLPAYNRRGN